MGNTDSIPVISQLKSLVQVIAGDVEGARKTQENFRDMAPVYSQITSLVHAANGDNEAARNVQEKFAKGLETFVDGLPVVGHIKGGIHYALGEKDKGDEIMKGANKLLLSVPAGVAGFMAGGPAGGAAAAIAAGQAYDGIVTGIDTAVNGKINGAPRYYGSWHTYDRIGKGKASPGEIFDTSAGIAFDGLSGAIGMKIGKGVKGYFKAVGREFIDEVPGGSQIRKLKMKRRHNMKGKQKIFKEQDIDHKSRCRRDVEYHLTANESSFVNEHLALKGGVGSMISANWRNMTVPDTVSSLVSLFVVLKLILWNDKSGRNYSRELCSYTSHSENEINNCQFELLVNLRLLENQMQHETDQILYTFITNPDIQSAMGNSSRVMIQLVMELFGMLSSIGDLKQMGILWTEELCIFKSPGEFVSCENELIERLHSVSMKAHYLGGIRKRRSPRCSVDGIKTKTIKKKTKTNYPDVEASVNRANIPKLSNVDLTKIKSDMVGPYTVIRSKKYRKDHNIDPTTRKLEANHIPPLSVCKNEGFKNNEITAHYLPKDIHQRAMTNVGTSKNSKVANVLRKQQRELIHMGKLDDAIALDIVGSYGRANAEFATTTNPNTFRPALLEYRNDLHAVINSYVRNDNAKIGKTKISTYQAKGLHDLIEKQVELYETDKSLTVTKWFKEMEKEYKNILHKGLLDTNSNNMVPKVLPEKQGYGR